MKKLRPVLLALAALLFVGLMIWGFIWMVLQSGDPAPVSPSEVKAAALAPKPLALQMADIIASVNRPVPFSTANITPANISSAAELYDQIESKKRELANFWQQTQVVLTQATARATGDPAELQRLNQARQEYESYAQNQLKVLNDLQVRLNAYQVTARKP